CGAGPLSMEVLPQLNSADVVLVNNVTRSGTQGSAFTSDPLFQAMPAVKAGHWVSADSGLLAVAGPDGVSYLFTSIATHDGVVQSYSRVATGAQGNFALD